MKRMFQKFFPKETEDRAQQFANLLPEHKLSMAKLQGHFLKHKDDPDKTLEQANSLLDMDF